MSDELKKAVGRPKLDKEKMVSYTFRLPESVGDELLKRAKEDDRTGASLLRKIIKEYLADK